MSPSAPQLVSESTIDVTDLGSSDRPGEFRVVSSGVAIAGQVVGSGTPLIWAHGLLSTRALTLQTLDSLAGYKVAAFDQRGHGLSEPVTDPNLYTPELTAADILTILDTLGWDAAVVGGDSMGSLTALTFARLHPERTRGLVLDRIAISDEPHPMLRLEADAELIRAGGLEEKLQSVVERYPENVRQLLFDRYVSYWRSHDRSSIAAAYEGVGRWRLNMADLASIEAPTAIRAWPDDPIYPLELARRVAEQIPNAELIEVQSAARFDPRVDQESMLPVFRSLHDRLGI